jgi:hypothetical protein
MASGRQAILEESWRRTIGGISTLLGRLAYLASLRNVNTGFYEHFGLAERVGAAEVALGQNATPIIQHVACGGFVPYCPPGFTRACGPYRCWCRPCY